MEKLHFLFVVDRSGSMSSIREQTFAGINTQIESVQNNGAREGIEVRASLLLFDTRGDGPKDWFSFVFFNKLSSEIQTLKWDDFVPSGMTPLNDAIAHGVSKVQEVLEPETQVQASIFTDGHENSSVEFKREQILKMISALTETNWTFSFVGAGGIAEVQTTAASYGIGAQYVAAYDGSQEQARETFSKMAATTTGCATRMLMTKSAKMMAGAESVNFFDAPENHLTISG